MLIALEIGFHACPCVIVCDHACHGEIGATGEDHGMVVATCVFPGWRTDGILRKRAHTCNRCENLCHLSTGTGGRLPGADTPHQCAYASGGSELARHLIASLQEPGDDRFTAPAAIQADLGPSAFLQGVGIFSSQAEPTLHRV